MKTIKSKSTFFGMMLLAMSMLFASSCKKDVSGGLTGWYADLSYPAKQSDFNEINMAIINHELLKSYYYSGEYHNYYATYDLFVDSDGYYSDSDPHCGRLRFSINNAFSAIQIVDGSTLKYFGGGLYVEGGYGTSGMEPFYKLYAGSIFGNMAYYGTPIYYTYVKSDNKIMVSNGDIYTITNGGLVKDGSSTVLDKYDPSKRYGSAGGNNGGGNNGGGNSGGGTNVSGSYNGHDYVDLGLPSGTLWATCNVGASSPEGYGKYYAWGETNTKSDYGWSNYKYANGAYYKLTKYCNRSSYGNNGFTDNLTVLQSGDDAATANWGSGWHMPTRTEMEELCYLPNTWTTRNGVSGRLFTAYNGNTLFLPAAGMRGDGYDYDAGNRGYYWSSSLGPDKPSAVWLLCFTSGDCSMYDYNRNSGYSVRPVRSASKN